MDDRPQESLNSMENEYKAKYPSVAVSVNWDSIGMLDSVHKESLVDACFHHNPFLGLSVDSTVALCAITRVDLSKNSFQTFPSALLELRSLVKLNLTRNQIANIPEDSSVLCVSLEELHLKENRLESLPKFIFQLPLLKYLDVSVNRITEMPAEMWTCPSLISLNLSRNCLLWLPTLQRDQTLHRSSTSNSMTRFYNGSLRKDTAASYSGSFNGAEFYMEENETRDSLADFTTLTMHSET